MNPDDFKAALLKALGRGGADDPPKPTSAPVNHPLLAALNGSSASSATGNAQFEQLVASPFADTLRALTGAPSGYAHLPMSAQTLGVYSTPRVDRSQPLATRRDTISLSDALFATPPARRGIPDSFAERRLQPEFVLTHEQGHRLAAAAPESALRNSQDSTYFKNLPTGHGKDPYWANDTNEHFAEAFANAVALLRHTAGQHGDPDVAHRVAPLAAAYEQSVPGTGLMVKHLLGDPVYARHPLNAKAWQFAPSDATTVRRP